MESGLYVLLVVILNSLASRCKTIHLSAGTEYFWETLMEILWMVDLKSYFEFHNKDIPVTVCLLAVWFSFKHSALVHTVSATNMVQFSVCMCVWYSANQMSDLWPVCLPVCLSNSLSLTCFTCLFASCCFPPALPPCLQPARANRRDEESRDQRNTCDNAGRCTLTQSILASKPQTFPSKLDSRPPHPSRHPPEKAWAVSYLVWENHAKVRSSKQAWEAGTISAFGRKSANEWHHIWKWLWLLATISVTGFMIFLKHSVQVRSVPNAAQALRVSVRQPRVWALAYLSL